MLSNEQFLKEREACGIELVKESISSNNEVYGGTPCLIGTRMPIARLLAEICDKGVDKVAEDMDIDKELLNKAFCGISILFEFDILKPFCQNSV